MNPYQLDALERRLLMSGRVVGYFPEYRWSTFGSIDWDAVTHLNYFSLSANSDGSLSTGNINVGHMQTLVSAAHGHGDTVSITVGPQSFSTIAQTPAALTNFANNIVQFAETYNLDGIDIDWEPSPRGSDIARYGTLVNALHVQTSTRGLLLTAAVNPINKEMPLAATTKMDWLNVMCYDFWPADHSNYADSTEAMDGWHAYGVPKDKLVMGVPFYGRKGTTWTNTVPRTYAALVNDYFVANNTYPAPDVDVLDGYHFNGRNTIRNKAEFVRDNSYGGVMIWELGQDHFVGGQFTEASLLPVIKSVFADVTPPAVSNSSFAFATAPHTLRFTFSENVAASLQPADLSVRDVATQASILVTGVTWNGATNTATFTLNNVVPDGRYRATLSGSGVSDPGGNELGDDHVHEFFFLMGDANHDAAVNLADFNILATNFGQSPRDFTQGDFNYDGIVNLADFNVLAGRFGASVAPAATSSTSGRGDLFDAEDDEEAAMLV